MPSFLRKIENRLSRRCPKFFFVAQKFMFVMSSLFSDFRCLKLNFERICDQEWLILDEDFKIDRSTGSKIWMTNFRFDGVDNLVPGRTETCANWTVSLKNILSVQNFSFCGSCGEKLMFVLNTLCTFWVRIWIFSALLRLIVLSQRKYFLSFFLYVTIFRGTIEYMSSPAHRRDIRWPSCKSSGEWCCRFVSRTTIESFLSVFSPPMNMAQLHSVSSFWPSSVLFHHSVVPVIVSETCLLDLGEGECWAPPPAVGAGCWSCVLTRTLRIPFDDLRDTSTVVRRRFERGQVWILYVKNHVSRHVSKAWTTSWPSVTNWWIWQTKQQQVDGWSSVSVSSIDTLWSGGASDDSGVQIERDLSSLAGSSWTLSTLQSSFYSSRPSSPSFQTS